jgi:hypothetical protein
VRDRAVGQVADEVVADVAERSLVERRVHESARARSLALEQRGDDAERRPHARAHVDQRRADAHARTTRLAGHADQSSCRLHERVVARFRSEWPRAAVGADRAVDEPRVARSEHVGAEPEPLGEAGAEALEEDVRPVGQPEDDLPTALVRQGDRERALARVHGEEHRALPVPEGRAPGAAVVARVGPLDLHHVGAERGEDLGAVRPRDRRRHVDDASAGEGEEGHARIIAGRPRRRLFGLRLQPEPRRRPLPTSRAQVP